MAGQTEYICETCHQKQTIADTATAPECCGQTMKPVLPLPVCDMPASAEHSRMEENIEPCDDGRGGGNR
jgi:hypothetical protein